MSVNSSLLLGLLDLAPELQVALGDAWPDVRDQLLLIAGRLDNEGDTASLRRELDSLVDRLLKIAPPATAATIRMLLRKPLTDTGVSPTLRGPYEPARAVGGTEPVAEGGCRAGVLRYRSRTLGESGRSLRRQPRRARLWHCRGERPNASETTAIATKL